MSVRAQYGARVHWGTSRFRGLEVSWTRLRSKGVSEARQTKVQEALLGQSPATEAPFLGRVRHLVPVGQRHQGQPKRLGKSQP